MIGRKDIMCKCGCGKATLDYVIVDIVDGAIRIIDEVEEYNVNLVIHSGFRCEEYNGSVGGNKNSYHMEGLALDFHVDLIPMEVLVYFIRVASERLGINDFIDIVIHETFIHVEFDRRRWLLNR